MVYGGFGVQQIHSADGLFQRATSQLRQQLPHFFGHELHEIHHELRLAGELFAQLGILRGYSHRASVQVADSHHHAARHHQRRSCEAEFFCAQQGCDHHISACLELPVGLHHDSVAQVVEQQGLLRLCQAQLPRGACVLDGCERGRSRAAVVAGNQHHIAVSFGNAGRHSAHANLRNQLHMDASFGIGIFQVVDELGQVFNGIDVVMRRRRD